MINQILKCSLCKNIHGQNDVVIGEGDTKRANIYIIGQDPGADEITEKRPFCGRSGKLLREAMKEADIDEKRTYITNMNLHRSKDNKGFSLKERQACWETFGTGMIKNSDAHIVITVGAKATETLFRNYGIKWFSFSNAIENPCVAYVEGKLRYVIACIHPAYVLRGGGIGSQRYNELIGQLSRAAASRVDIPVAANA